MRKLLALKLIGMSGKKVHGILFFGLILVNISCGGGNREAAPKSTGWKDLPNAYAQGFVVQQNDAGHGRLVILNPTKAQDTLQIIDAPLSSHHIACLSTTHLALLKAIGLADSICATGFGYLVKDPYFRNRLSIGTLTDLTTGEDISREKFMAAKPQTFLVYPFGHANYSFYEEMGIPCVPVCEYLESHPLGRAEWLVALGWLFNKMDTAKEVFDAIRVRYTEAEGSASRATTHPNVFSGTSNGGVWHVPPGNSFAGHLIESAGATYMFSDSIHDGNIQLSEERFIALSNAIDWWGIVIDKQGIPEKSDFTDKQNLAEHIPAITHNQLFYCNTASCDYFGDAVIQPDIVLKDLIYIFHPELLPDHQSVYFHACP